VTENFKVIVKWNYLPSVSCNIKYSVVSEWVSMHDASLFCLVRLEIVTEDLQSPVAHVRHILS